MRGSGHGRWRRVITRRDCDTSDTSPHLTPLLRPHTPPPPGLSRSTKAEQAPAWCESRETPLETPTGELEKKTSAGESRRPRTTHVGQRPICLGILASIWYFGPSRDAPLKPSARWVLRGCGRAGEGVRVSGGEVAIMTQLTGYNCSRE